jgi:hypothetical protein
MDSKIDPVVVAALEDLRASTLRRRRVNSLSLEKRRKSLQDPTARRRAIHTFKHLKHNGFVWEPEEVREWALSHGWKPDDVVALVEYATGVRSGIRFNGEDPDPIGRQAISRWQEHAGREVTPLPGISVSRES